MPMELSISWSAAMRWGNMAIHVQPTILKINKKASGRHKDLDDLEHLP